MNSFATDSIKPDLTFLFDIEPKKANVATTEFGEKDKIESRDLDFHERVRQGYLQIAHHERERFRVIPYKENDIDGMQEQVRAEVERYIQEHRLRNKLLRRN